MRCPACGSDSRVLDSREELGASAIRRRRICKGPGEHRFTTSEHPEVGLVLKRQHGKANPFDDSAVEPFNAQKLLDGLCKAVVDPNSKRPALQRLVASIGETAYKQGTIESAQIGKLVMEGLRDIDQLAYLRYASVHLSFTELSQMRIELGKLERPEEVVLSRDGNFEPFDRDKLRAGVLRAMADRSPVLQEVDELCDEIHARVHEEKVVETKWLGREVMRRLRSLDEVAFLRYASVHMEYDSGEQFFEGIAMLNDFEDVRAGAEQLGEQLTSWLREMDENIRDAAAHTPPDAGS